MFLVLGYRGAWVSYAPPGVPEQRRPWDAALPPVSGSRLAASPAWHGLPQCPGYGHWVSYCCVALVFWSGLCLGSGVGCVPPLVAGVLAVCVWVQVVVSPFLSRLRFAVFAVGLWFPFPTILGWGFAGCVVVCALRLYLAVPGSGVRCACVCLGSGFGCAPPLLGEVLGCVRVCVRAPPGPLHLLAGGAVRGCVPGPGLQPRPATPVSVVGAWVCLCAHPASTPSFLADVCVVGVCDGLLFRLCPSTLGWGVRVCVRVCVCPASTPPFLAGWCVCLCLGFVCSLVFCWLGCWGAGAPVALGCAGAAVAGVRPPPPLWFLFFLWGGGCRGFVVSVAGCPGLGSRAHRPPFPSRSGCAFVFLFLSLPQRGMCRQVRGVLPFLSALAVPELTFLRRSVWADRHCCCRARGGPLLVRGGRVRRLPCVVCGGLVGLDPPLVSLALVLWCAVVRRAVSCCVLPCRVMLARALLRCAVLCCAVLRRVVPWCAALCRIAPRRALVCRVFGCLVVVRCTVVSCCAVCRAASCCAVVGRWWLVRPVSWCGVRVGVWLAGDWGVRLGVGWLAGRVLWGSGCPARACGSGGRPRGCPPWGPVPWSRAIWGFLPLAPGAVAAPSSSSKRVPGGRGGEWGGGTARDRKLRAR